MWNPSESRCVQILESWIHSNSAVFLAFSFRSNSAIQNN